MIELRSGALRLVIAPEVGGAVAAFERDGLPLFRATPAEAIAAGDVRRFASYPLVPFSNRIAGAMLHWSGKTYPLARYLADEPHAIHGNGWQRAWRVVAAGPSQAQLELVHEPAGTRAREWPFDYRARQGFALAPEAATMTLEITNTGTEAFPCGLGWHPFFPRNAATELGFAAAGMWVTDATKLPACLDAIAAACDFSEAKPIGDIRLDNCFAGWRPPATIRWPEREIALEIDADAACRHVVVYIPSGRDYFALEPVSHMTDAFNRAARRASDVSETGTRYLAPGETFSCTMRISVRCPS